MTTYVANVSSIGFAFQTVVAVAVAAIFIMSIVSFVMAIWDFVRSEGEEDAKKKGWNRIRFMMIGILLTIFFLFMLPILLKYLGIMDYDMFSAQNIFARIGQLMNQLFALGSHVQNYYRSDSFGSLEGGLGGIETSSSVEYSL